MFGEKSNLRRYQCFVCGLQFDNDQFDEFSAHIVDNHEEGRDYVLCPLNRCKAPIRDVRAHFKARHGSEKLPQAGMMKATIWRDVSPQGKTKKKTKFREGWHESNKMQKNFYYRSGWEKIVYECLDSWNEVVAYDVEPFKIPYIHNGECHDYIPDLFVAFLDGHKEIWEVKPTSQTSLKKNQDKWFSARKACEAREWEFVVVTEQIMEKLKKKVKNQYLEDDTYSDDDGSE
jgi:rubredoxin